MRWDVVREGFEDELMKIAEMSLAGLSSETLMNYPQPAPMPSSAYEKAQAILAKLPPAPPEVEKVSYLRPDMMPQLKRISRRRGDDPPPGVADKAIGYGTHLLAGTGAAKFTGDAVEKMREGFGGHAPFKAKTKALILAGGAAAGLANKVRKEHRRKKWQEGHHP